MAIMPPTISSEESDYIWANPGKVHRYQSHAKAPWEAVATVLLPEISEPKHVTRERLWRGVVEAFHGADNEVWDDLHRAVFEGELLILEYGIRVRLMGVVLQ